MKFSKLILYSLVTIILMSSVMACGTEKEYLERKNLMMPKKSEMMRNSRYKEVEKRKTYKPKSTKSKKKSLF